MDLKTNFHPLVIETIKAFSQNLKAGILLEASNPQDLKDLSKILVDYIYGKDQVRLENLYCLNSPKIADVRNLLNLLNKTSFASDKPRLIIIEQAEILEPISQNALLKGLEEPPLGSYFVLTTTDSSKILNTVKSRCQQLKVRKPPKAVLKTKYSKVEAAKFEQAYLAAAGEPRLIEDYLNNPNSLIHHQINLGKVFLRSSPDKRLQQIFAKNSDFDLKQNLPDLLLGLWRILKGGLSHSLKSQPNPKIQAYYQRFVLVNQFLDDLELGKINHKLIALNLCLKL